MAGLNVVPIRSTGGTNNSSAFLASDGAQWVKVPIGEQPPTSASGGGSANPPHSNGGDDMRTPFESLKLNVKFLNWALGGMFFGGVALIGALHVMLDDKIEVVRKDVVEVQKSLSGQDATLNAIDANVSRLISANGEVSNASKSQPSTQGK